MAIIDVPAPMRGTIYELCVNVGDSVDAGAELIIVESMKMEIAVESPGAGKVTEVLVQVGDSVDEGDPVVRLEPA